jgi:hypothetical protein
MRNWEVSAMKWCPNKGIILVFARKYSGKTTKNLIQESLCPGHVSNGAPPENKS